MITYLDSECSDHSDDIQWSTKDMIAWQARVVFPDGSRGLHSSNLGNVRHDSYVGKIYDMF